LGSCSAGFFRRRAVAFDGDRAFSPQCNRFDDEAVALRIV
jgi:hypothetical protein